MNKDFNDISKDAPKREVVAKRKCKNCLGTGYLSDIGIQCKTCGGVGYVTIGTRYVVSSTDNNSSASGGTNI